MIALKITRKYPITPCAYFKKKNFIRTVDFLKFVQHLYRLLIL